MQASKLVFKNDKSGNADDRRANGKHANSQRDGATCKRATVYVAQRRFPFIKGKGLGAFYSEARYCVAYFVFARGRHAAGIIGGHRQHPDPDQTHGRRGADQGVCRCHLL